VKENKPKTHKCSKCTYSSSNYSEFGVFYNQDDAPITVCLSCMKKDFDVMLTEADSKISAKIEERKNQTIKGKIINFNNQNVQDKKDLNPIIFPKQINEILNKRIIGQDEAKEKISIAISNHLRRINNPQMKFEKSNVLLIGPTGTGKTEFFRTIAKELSLPFTTCSATNLTAAGYVGQDVPQILAPLVTSIDDVYLAEKGIVLIDEIDKLAGDGDSDVNTIRVQKELLKVIEGDIVQVNIGESKHHPHFIDINTENILFICAGAFSGLKESINEETKFIGLKTFEKKEDKSQKDWTRFVTTKDLTKYGLMPELLGRLPVVTYTEELTVEILEKILVEPSQSLISQYVDLMSSYNVSVSFSKKFIKQVALEAFEHKLGARGLRKIMEQKMASIIMKIDQYQNQSLIIEEDYVEVEKHSLYIRGSK